MSVFDKLRFGERPQIRDLVTAKGVLGPSAVPVAVPASPPIQVARWTRNGKHPNAILGSMKGEAANQAALYKAKETFRTVGLFGGGFQSHGMTAGSGTCNRWRVAFRTGPYSQFLDVEVMLTQDSSFGTASSYGQLDITETATAAVTTATFPVGATAISRLSAALVRRRIQVKPGTDYTAVFSDHGSDMWFTNMHELASLSTFFGGVLPQNLAAGGPILDAYRRNEAEVIRALWQQSAWPIFNWCVEDDTLPPTTTSASMTNLVDAFVSTSGTTTLGTSNIDVTTPGFYVDTTGRARRSQSTTGIPFLMAVYGSTADLAYVEIVDPHGNQVVYGEEILGVTPGWSYVVGSFPAGIDQKYDIRFCSSAGNATKIGAVCVYELEG